MSAPVRTASARAAAARAASTQATSAQAASAGDASTGTAPPRAGRGGGPAGLSPRGADPLGVRARARRSALLLGLLAVASALSIVLCVGIGPVPIPASTTVQVIAQHVGLPVGGASEPAIDSIVWDVRVPRVLMGAAVGACLALSGAALQAMVRNMLADPYILGVSGGASTGAAAAILFGVGAALGDYAQSVLAFFGALAAALLVFLIARAGGRVTSLRLLLSGVAVGYALTALTNLLIFSSDSAEGSRSVMFWMLGSLSLARWNAFLWVALAAGVAGTLVLLGSQAEGHSPSAAASGTEAPVVGTVRQEHFAEAYDEGAVSHLDFARADIERICAAWEEAGFVDVQADPLPELLALDRAHGVAPGHSPQLLHRFTARRAS
jgi:hypothetical protein